MNTQPPAPPPPRERLAAVEIHAGAAPAANALVLLAGAYDGPQDFITAGFVDALRTTGAALDLILVESDLAAVCDGSLPQRLQSEIVEPVQATGRRVFTGGISIGGLTALMHADRFAHSTAGMVLFAPYPGSRVITGEIAAAGGLANWPAAADYPANDERRGWRALQTLALTGQLPLWLGYGAEDRFAKGHALMAAGLAETNCCALPGGHDWLTWLALWRHALDWLAPRLAR